MHSAQANAEQIKSFRLSSKRFRKYVHFLNDLERFVCSGVLLTQETPRRHSKIAAN